MRSLLIFVSMVAFAQNSTSPPGMRCPERTLVFSEFGENAANAGQFRDEHLTYMAGLMKSGKVILAGPMDDHQSAAILFASKDWSEVDELLKKEPFHREHVLKVANHKTWTACEPAP
jgi:uncharacterized protein YciI